MAASAQPFTSKSAPVPSTGHGTSASAATAVKRVFLSAGEASGDAYGAQIIEALRPYLHNATYTGLGGSSMEAAGQSRVVKAEDVAVMGITEILRHVPRIYGAYRKLVREIHRNRPDVAILIDFPDVNFRLAKHLKKMDVPVLWFVSPQLWAWKRQRLRWVQKRVAKMFVIFPFEEQFYKNRGVDAQFVGHPLADMPLPTISREEYAHAAGHDLDQQQWLHAEAVLRSNPMPEWAYQTRQGIRYDLDPAKPWVALLPGSRGGEIHSNLPEMVEAANLLGDSYEFLIPVADTVRPERLRQMQREVAARLSHPDSPRITFVRDARAALLHSKASVVASGTATVQAALIGNPFLVIYRVSDLTYQVAKRLVKYPGEIGAKKDGYGNLPIAMPNLIAGKRIVPELLNKQAKAKTIAPILQELLEDSSPIRRRQIEDLKSVRDRLHMSNGNSAIDSIRDSVLAALNPTK